MPQVEESPGALLLLSQWFTRRLQVKGVPRLLWTVRRFLVRPESTYVVYRDRRLEIDNNIVYQWWNVVNYGGFEIVLIMERLLRPGDVVIDIGANIGYMSVNAASLVGKEGMVIAVEPEPRARRRLIRNLQLNQAATVRVLSEAIGEREGTATFCIASEEGLSRLDTGSGQNPCMTQTEAIQVSVTTLDAVAMSLASRPIRLVKMDVEGFEYSVLRGASALLQRNETIFIFEYNAGALAQNRVALDDIFTLLSGAQYRLYAINAHSSDWFRLSRFPSFERILDCTRFARRAMDVLAVPEALHGRLSLDLN